MAPLANNPLPVVTVKRFEVIPGLPINTRQFLQGLKRPRPETTPASATREKVTDAIKALDELPVNVVNELSSKILHSSPPWPDKTSNERDNLSNEFLDFSEVRSVAQTKKIKSSCRQDEQILISSPLFCSQDSIDKDTDISQHHQDERDAQRPETIVAETSNPEALGRSRASVKAKPRRRLRPKSKEKKLATVSTSDSDIVTSRKKKASKASKSRKKRRAPINKLPLVYSLPMTSNSRRASASRTMAKTTLGTSSDRQPTNDLDDPDLALTGEIHDPLENRSPSVRRPRPRREANIRRPVTKLRKEVTMPQYHRIPHDGFKFPPTTPRPKRDPGWKLGSGFEGMKLQTSVGSKIVRTHRSSPQRARHIRFQPSTSRALEVSTVWSPCLRRPKTRRPLNEETHSVSCVPTNQLGVSGRTITPHSTEFPSSRAVVVQDDHEAIFAQVHDLATLLCPSREIRDTQIPERFHSTSASRRSDSEGKEMSSDHAATIRDTQGVREPSKSERNGWLKRRRRVSFSIDADAPAQRDVPKFREGSEIDIIDRKSDVCNPSPHIENLPEPNTTANSRPVSSATRHLFTSTGSQSSQICQQGSTIYTEFDSNDEGDVILDDPGPVYTNRATQRQKRPTQQPQSSPITSRYRPLIRTSSSHFQVATMLPRPQEIEDSQERSMDASHMVRAESATHVAAHYPNPSAPLLSKTNPIPETSLNAHNYFSKAIDQLSSPTKTLHPTSRRKSHHQPEELIVHDSYEDRKSLVTGNIQPETPRINMVAGRGSLKRSRTEHGNLDLGVTPRLKRTMSTFPFQPPFKKF